MGRADKHACFSRSERDILISKSMRRRVGTDHGTTDHDTIICPPLRAHCESRLRPFAALEAAKFPPEAARVEWCRLRGGVTLPANSTLDYGRQCDESDVLMVSEITDSKLVGLKVECSLPFVYITIPSS